MNDYELHNLAGLTDAGISEEEGQLWIGTDKQWQKYEDLLLIENHYGTNVSNMSKRDEITAGGGIEEDGETL